MFFGSVSVVPCLCWSRVVGIEEKMLSIFVRHIHACKFMQSVLIVETSSCREDILFVLSYIVMYGLDLRLRECIVYSMSQSESGIILPINFANVGMSLHMQSESGLILPISFANVGMSLHMQCWYEFAHAVLE